MEKTEWAIDTRIEWIGLALFLVVAIVGGSVYVSAEHPGLDDKVYAEYFMEKPDYAGGEIQFNQLQKYEMNKAYEDKRDEFARCLRVEGDGAVSDLAHPVKILNVSETEIRSKCFINRFNGLLHSHPGTNYQVQFSDQDRKVLREISWIKVSCVLNDPVPLNVDRNPGSLKCLKYEDGGFQEVEVSFTGDLAEALSQKGYEVAEYGKSEAID